jgi:hypothetical protein
MAKKTATKAQDKKSETLEQLMERAIARKHAMAELTEEIDAYETAVNDAQDLIALLGNGNEDHVINEVQGTDAYGNCSGLQTYNLSINNLEIRAPLIDILKKNLARWQRELADLLDG